MQSLDQIWESVLTILKEKNAKSVYDLWFADTKLIFLDGERAAVTIDSDLKKDIIEKRYVAPMTMALCEVIGFDPEITVFSSEKGVPDVEKLFSPEETQKEVQEEPNFEGDGGEVGDIFLPQKFSGAGYTFENFIVGSSNKMAHAACTAIAKRPVSSFNPLFIYGASGLGKTHLLYAIIHELHRNFPNLRIIYVKGEDFTNELVESIGNESTVEFRNKYRKADVLLIDDIQFIAGKNSTQQEFFHTFDA